MPPHAPLPQPNNAQPHHSMFEFVYHAERNMMLLMTLKDVRTTPHGEIIWPLSRYL